MDADTKQKLYPAKQVTCEICGVTFETRSRRATDERAIFYCSTKCRNQAQLERYHAKARVDNELSYELLYDPCEFPLCKGMHLRADEYRVMVRHGSFVPGTRLRRISDNAEITIE